MKSRVIAAVLAAGLMCISSQANAAGLLSIFGGYGGGGCGCDNTCGCDVAPKCGCDRGCHRGCGCRSRCHRGCGCNQSCGYTVAAPSCAVQAPSCGYEKSCGCDRGCHRGCGCRDRCHRGCGCGWNLFNHGCGCRNTCGCDTPAPSCGYEGAPVYGGKM